jgi:hypothetical protein
LVAIPVLKTIYYRSAQEMKLSNMEIIASNEFIELISLKVEADGMQAENQYRQQAGYGPAYVSDDFYRVAEKMRALKAVDAKPEQQPTPQGQNAQSSTSPVA